MTTAYIFLNGYYDAHWPDFYRAEIQNATQNCAPLICADGGIRIFDTLNKHTNVQISPDILIGDMDSRSRSNTSAKHTVRQWIGKTDKDCTDGQLAVDYAIQEFHAQHILLYGGLPRPHQYETDHFLGNLKLMPYGYHRTPTRPLYKAEMRDPKQSIHYVTSAIHLTRKNGNLQRVSLVANTYNAMIRSSTNLRWELTNHWIHPDLTNALRNEFVEGAESVTLQLANGSTPIYVIHNW